MSRTFAAAGLLAALLGSTAAHAGAVQLINFDDVTTQFAAPIQNGYAGLLWQNFGVVAAAYASPIGLFNSVVSTDYVAFNPDPTSISAFGSESRFTFKDGFFGAAARDGLTLAIGGFRGGQLTHLAIISLDTLGPLYERFNWGDVDTVLFSSGGGTLDPAVDPAQDSTIFAMDDLRVQFVPEPATFALFGLGLGAVALRRARRA